LKEKKNIGHEFVVSGDASYLQKLKSLKVVVDVTNSREVHMLRDILVAWNGVLEELHILFKVLSFYALILVLRRFDQFSSIFFLF